MEDTRKRADERLDQALAAAGLEDPRPAYRDRLKALRAEDPPAFARALEYFEATLVPSVAGGAEPLAEWVAYGRLLAEQGGPGRLVSVDAGGRASPYQPPPAGDLLLFLPDDGRRFVVPLLVPRTPSQPQQATVDLLVRGRREPS
jgi:hypothetical protein